MKTNILDLHGGCHYEDAEGKRGIFLFLKLVQFAIFNLHTHPILTF
jgi:hypothetical protein